MDAHADDIICAFDIPEHVLLTASSPSQSSVRFTHMAVQESEIDEPRITDVDIVPRNGYRL
jgi:hypothetical protein